MAHSLLFRPGTQLFRYGEIIVTLTALFPLHTGPPSSNLLQEVGQFDQILVAKQGSPRRDFDKNIAPSGIRAVGWNRLQLAVGGVEINAILAPVIPKFHQLELTPGQRMERVGYVEMFLRTVVVECT